MNTDKEKKQNVLQSEKEIEQKVMGKAKRREF